MLSVRASIGEDLPLGFHHPGHDQEPQQGHEPDVEQHFDARRRAPLRPCDAIAPTRNGPGAAISRPAL